MRLYTEENPKFSETIKITETTDPGNATIVNAATKQLLQNDLVLNERINKCLGNIEGGDIKLAEGIKADNLVEAINEVFTLGNEKKNKLVENLVAMGMKASTEESWEELLDKVLDMTDTSGDTVTAGALLARYTAHDASGKQITGIMPEKAGTTVDTTGVTQDDSYTYLGVPEGHYDANSKVRAINSDISHEVVNLGGGASFDLKSYPGWKDFAVNKNIFLVSSVTFRIKRSGWPSGWNFDESFVSKPTATYNNGILSISSGDGSRTFVESGESGNVTVWWTNTWNAYLVC